MQESKRIVVGVDGSKSSVLALQWAAKLAPGLDASIAALMVWRDATAYDGYAWMPTGEFEDHARKQLEDTVAAAYGDNPPDSLSVDMVEGHAAQTLIKESETAEMLVLGTRGHGGFAGLLMGSVSRTCAAHSHCPVLVVPKGSS